jgi:hypothetical protein
MIPLSYKAWIDFMVLKKLYFLCISSELEKDKKSFHSTVDKLLKDVYGI